MNFKMSNISLNTDYHQDKTRQESEFVTIYIYLDKVNKDSSALNILLGSHKLGFTSYPHFENIKNK